MTYISNGAYIVSFFQRNENEPLGVVHVHILSFIISIKNMDYKIKQKLIDVYLFFCTSPKYCGVVLPSQYKWYQGFPLPWIIFKLFAIPPVTKIKTPIYHYHM